MTLRLWHLPIDQREWVRLYVDGIDKRIPLQYRFLSFYKMLELEFKQGQAWDKIALETFFKPFERQFIDQGFRARPVNELHRIRDMCAHIKSGRKGNSWGVTHLNREAVATVERVLPILKQVSVAILNKRSLGKFGILPPISLPVDPGSSDTRHVPTPQ